MIHPLVDTLSQRSPLMALSHQRCSNISEGVIRLREGRWFQETGIREPGGRNAMGTLASTSLDHDPGFKINSFFDTRDRQIEYRVSEGIRLPRKFKHRFRHIQVMQDKTLIVMVVRWNNHQALLQVVNWARVFITKMLMYQVGCSLYAFPINGPVIKQVERCN